MPPDLAPTIALGVGSALLAFEGIAALKSLADIHVFGDRGTERPAVRPRREPVTLTTHREIRAHLVASRGTVNGLRRQYPTLGSSRHGRQLRAEIARVRRHDEIGPVRAWTPPVREPSRLDGERLFELRVRLAQAYSLMTPTRNRITTTMTITPTIPTPPLR